MKGYQKSYLDKTYGTHITVSVTLRSHEMPVKINLKQGTPKKKMK